MFETAETLLEPVDGFAPAEWATVRYGGLDAARALIAAREKRVSDGLEAVAQCSYSRWQVKCPLRRPWDGQPCTEAQHGSKDDPRFFCTTCLNAEAGGAFVPVRWPDEVEEIEAELERRPWAEVRHWVDGETVAELRAQTDAILNVPEEIPAEPLPLPRVKV